MAKINNGKPAFQETTERAFSLIESDIWFQHDDSSLCNRNPSHQQLIENTQMLLCTSDSTKMSAHSEVLPADDRF